LQKYFPFNPFVGFGKCYQDISTHSLSFVFRVKEPVSSQT